MHDYHGRPRAAHPDSRPFFDTLMLTFHDDEDDAPIHDAPWLKLASLLIIFFAACQVTRFKMWTIAKAMRFKMLPADAEFPDVLMGTSPIVNRSAVAGFVRRWDMGWASMIPLAASTLVDRSTRKASLLRLKDKFHNSFEGLESGFGVQYASSPSYKKFNPGEIGRQVELQRQSVEAPPTLLRLKDKFHNFFLGAGIKAWHPMSLLTKLQEINPEEIGRQVELERETIPSSRVNLAR
ncbi:hypothetical protein B0H13DRAFT_2316055 [Mycena leptocephala]|nr:hypothetical protein B0H13DRAFT_2316055 [Mycena leptocephala]